MRKLIPVLVLVIVLVCAVLIPSVSFTEDEDTLQLARVIYALGRTENYDVKMAIGTVVMNRVDSHWFGDTISDVLNDPQQFPSGERFDDDSLKAAHEVISGKRSFDRSILYYGKTDANPVVSRESAAAAGSYDFYRTDSMLTVTGLL